MKRFLNLIPLVVFVILVAVLYSFLTQENEQLESVLIDQSVPEFKLPALENPNNILSKSSVNKLPALINVWATWCIACRIEHPFLMQLKNKSTLTVYGLNYKDDRKKALDLLENEGNPFEFSIFDQQGKLAIDLGVYGAPETFYVDKEGIIRERHVGALTQKVWKEKFEKYLNEDNDA
ncbi:MAG: DsbE family thiol:disulfide interchange protein [SAR86 cluster bacterium]|nr:DsbE family thiol:disulfide interchange protein [SAR86 cluster bacterium]